MASKATLEHVSLQAMLLSLVRNYTINMLYRSCTYSENV